MKNTINKYYGLFIGGCGIALVVSAYLGIVLHLNLVTLIISCLTFIIVGILIYIRDSVLKNEKEALLSELKNEKEALFSNIEDFERRSLEAVTNSEEKVVNFSTQQFDIIEKDILTALQDCQNSTNSTITQKTLDVISRLSEINNMMSETIIERSLETNKNIAGTQKELISAIYNLNQNINQYIEKAVNSTQTQTSQLIEQCSSSIIAQSNNSTETLKNEIVKCNTDILNAVNDVSNDNAEFYRSLLSQISIMQRQNSHIMMLTTMIGTVRSDIATLNEVRSFKEEHKLGRKIRHVRDDEHGIVIENLMNSDGIRIEKSVMFKNDSLVFEADFDQSGRMTRSRNYSESSNTYTEITYSDGKVVKSVLSKLFETKK